MSDDHSAMRFLCRTLFAVFVLAACWLLTQVVHEAGHVAGAWIVGAKVDRVVLHPLAISRTDVSDNRHPLIVTWCGPLVGVLAPLALLLAVPRRWSHCRKYAALFAGFCLVANGLYLALGAMEAIGDCGVLIRHGTPVWLLWLVGGVAAAAGGVIWHRLGQPLAWLRQSRVTWRDAGMAFAVVAAIVAIELWAY